MLQSSPVPHAFEVVHPSIRPNSVKCAFDMYHASCMLLPHPDSLVLLLKILHSRTNKNQNITATISTNPANLFVVMRWCITTTNRKTDSTSYCARCPANLHETGLCNSKLWSSWKPQMSYVVTFNQILCKDFFAHVQTGPGAHPASCTMGIVSFPGVKRPGRGADHPSSAEVNEE
jgi:hypothetical protein